MTAEPAWKRRYRAAQIGFPHWSALHPDRLAFVSNEGGTWQTWLQDRRDGSRRRLSDEPFGMRNILVAPDGRVIWWHQSVGDERGHWVACDPDTGDAEPLVPGLSDVWAAGISFSEDAIAFGTSTEEDYRAFVMPVSGEPMLLLASTQALGVGRLEPEGTGGISADGRLVCVRHAEHGDIVHQALRVYDRTGAVVGELADPGSNLDPVAWSPIPGDGRLLFTSELGPFERPAIWKPESGQRRDIAVDLPGAVIALEWYSDTSALLIRHEHEGREQLYGVDVGTGTATMVSDPGGEISAAAIRPDGTLWLQTSDSVRQPRVIDDHGDEVLSPVGDAAPAGRRYEPFWFENPHGQSIQAFVVTPPGNGPWPTVMQVHGGPEWHERDRFDPEIQALVDAGYAVAQVNYRGSTGYGIAFRRALIGDPWFPETDDVIAGLDALVEAGIADPDRVAFAGWSWGGCLACLNEGLHADRWRAVFAGIPAGDFVAAHYACMPELQAYDLALYGGRPDERPELWAERNPMTYVDRAKAPVLVIAGEHDPRCPPEGVTPWVEALRERGVPVDVYFYPAGHHSNEVEEQIRQTEMILSFFERHL